MAVVVLVGSRSVPLAQGVHSIAATEGWETWISVSERSIRESALLHYCDLLIVDDTLDLDWAAIRRFDGPVVVIHNGDEPGIPRVIPDDHDIGRVAAAHLLRTGFEHFTAFGELTEFAWARRRVDAFAAGIQSAERSFIAPPPALGRVWFENNHAWSAWFDALPEPIGIFGLCDAWARQLTWYCQRNGRRVPDDVAILGADNLPIYCETSQPLMSSVVIPLYTAGRLAAELARDLRRGGAPPPAPITFPSDGVAARQTTDIQQVADPDVTAALAFLRQNSHRPIGVPDILRHIPVNRRKLERAFRESLGRTIHQEIARLHVDRAKYLLTVTELPMPEVARRSGFTSPARMAIRFRQLTALTPTDYRHQNRPQRV